jgi:methyl-accepting chemotaxis protein
LKKQRFGRAAAAEAPDPRSVSSFSRAVPMHCAMRTLTNLRFGPKLLLSFLVMLAFAGVIGFAAVSQLTRVARETDRIATESLGSVYRVSALGANATQSRAAALEVLTQLHLNLTGGAQESSRTLTEVEAQRQANAAAFEKLIRSPEQRALWDEARARWDDYKREQDRAISVAQDGLAEDAQKVLIGLAKTKFDRFDAAVRKLAEFSNADAERARQAADAAAAQARRTVLVLLALAAAIGCVIAFTMTQAITRPLQATVALLREIGHGRLDNRIDTTRRDEVGELLAGLAATQAQLLERASADQRRAEEDRLRAESDRRALEEVQGMVDAVVQGRLDRRLITEGKSGFARQLAEGLNQLIETVAALVSGVGAMVQSANAGDLTRRIDVADRSGLERELGSSVNRLIGEIASMVVQVKSAAQEVARGAAEISQGNDSLSQRTESQAASLEETAASMEQMTSTVRQNADSARQANELAIEAQQRAELGSSVVARAVQAMDGISAASRRIADIIGVIDEIAFQTNLLALNAAVEAARAGEQGRGFAVVANEVRTLASRSAEAAKEIKALIHDSVARVAEGTQIVSESGATFGQLVQAVKKVGQIIAEIAAASSEQASGIDQVGSAVAKMDEVTQQNAALVEQAAAASRALADQSHSLSALMSRYRVGEEAAGAAPRIRADGAEPFERRAAS